MKIQLSDAGKRYNRDWIFRHVSYNFEYGNSYAITGPNGSGKSTLLQTLGGSMLFSEGRCNWSYNGSNIADENIYKYMSICAPYLELVEEMTLVELLNFHQSFKPFLDGVEAKSIIDEIGLNQAGNKRISQYSSGMKQRVKLAQCIFSNTQLVLLDEPCTNLDADGIELYNRLVQQYCRGRLVIVSSNDSIEYQFCNETLNIMNFK